MKIWMEQVLYDVNNKLYQKYLDDKTLFFDIETTGFSPVNTHVYLIGCAYLSNNQICIHQFFSESPEDEIVILQNFFELMERFQTIITFNGIGFDIPYMKSKCEKYNLIDNFYTKNFIDLFKEISFFKFIIKLPNYKQKTVETFLGINRDDKYSGGDLIKLYKEYLLSPNEKQLSILKQHNFEDILGMLDLLKILSLREFFKGSYTLSNIETNSYKDYNGNLRKEMIFTLENEFSIPGKLSYCLHDFYLSCKQNQSKLTVHLYEGELKYFFENYEDYYYLPKEDMAVHKDLAFYVSKEYRKKATASTCYTKKNSLFLPQYKKIIKPLFYKNYKDKISYFELDEAFINSDRLLYDYIKHILEMMKSQKK